MAKEWYVLHTYSGYENKIEKTLKMLIEQEREAIADGIKSSDRVLLSEVVGKVKIPEEEVTETRRGKKRVVKKKFLPGYILVQMDLPENGWKEVCSKIRRISGVTGFLGTNAMTSRPQPLPPDDVKKIFQKAGEIKGDKTMRAMQIFEIGQQVRIKEGPLSTFVGLVDEVSPDRNKLKVTVEIFGRATPVDVEVDQVELM